MMFPAKGGIIGKNESTKSTLFMSFKSTDDKSHCNFVFFFKSHVEIVNTNQFYLIENKIQL